MGLMSVVGVMRHERVECGRLTEGGRCFWDVKSELGAILYVFDI